MERPHLFTLEDNNEIARNFTKFKNLFLLNQFYNIYYHNYLKCIHWFELVFRWAMWPMCLLFVWNILGKNIYRHCFQVYLVGNQSPGSRPWHSYSLLPWVTHETHEKGIFYLKGLICCKLNFCWIRMLSYIIIIITHRPLALLQFLLC